MGRGPRGTGKRGGFCTHDLALVDESAATPLLRYPCPPKGTYGVGTGKSRLLCRQRREWACTNTRCHGRLIAQAPPTLNTLPLFTGVLHCTARGDQAGGRCRLP